MEEKNAKEQDREQVNEMENLLDSEMEQTQGGSCTCDSGAFQYVAPGQLGHR